MCNSLYRLIIFIKINAKAADCLTEGYSGDLYCAICGEKLKDGTVQKALGHKEEILPGKAATETEESFTEGKKCSLCGKTLVLQQTLKKIESKAADGTMVGTGASVTIADARHCI